MPGMHQKVSVSQNFHIRYLACRDAASVLPYLGNTVYQFSSCINLTNNLFNYIIKLSLTIITECKFCRYVLTFAHSHLF